MQCKKNIVFAVLLLLLISGAINSQSKNGKLKWSQLSGLQSSFGTASKGISAPYAAIQHHTILFAGGCNFPSVPASEGGKKKYYADIFAYDIHTNQVWEKVGSLPSELAYGLSLNTKNEWFCIGGKNNTTSVSSVYRIRFNKKNKTTSIDSIVSLPVTCNNMCGGYLNGTIYVVAGMQNDIPSSQVWSLDLTQKHPKWRLKAPLPGAPRLQSISFTSNNCLYVISGYTPATTKMPSIVHQTGYRYEPHKNRWIPIPDFPSDDKGSTLSAGVTFPISKTEVACFGGVNKHIFEGALNREFETNQYKLSNKQKLDSIQQVSTNYLRETADFYQFNNTIWIFNTRKNTWKINDKKTAGALAGAAVTQDNKTAYIINGEIKPGIRTSKIWKIKFE